MMAASLIERMDFYGRIVLEGGFGAGTLAVAFVLLYRHFNSNTGRCDPGQSTIARGANVSTRHVKRAADELNQGGWFEVIVGGGSPTPHGPTTAYRPIFERMTESSGVTNLSGVRVTKSSGVTDSSPVTDSSGERVTNPSAKPSLKKTSKTLGRSAEISANRFDEFWSTYPSRSPHPNPKKPAAQKFAAAVKRGNDPAAIIAGARRYADHVNRHATAPQYVKQATTWLNQESWTESHAEPEARLRAGMC